MKLFDFFFNAIWEKVHFTDYIFMEYHKNCAIQFIIYPQY